MNTLTVRQFRHTLFDCVADARDEGETYKILEHGKPVAYLIGFEQYQKFLQSREVCDYDT